MSLFLQLFVSQRMILLTSALKAYVTPEHVQLASNMNDQSATNVHTTTAAVFYTYC